MLDAKGGENKGQSNKWISYHLRDFENSKIELLVCQNSFIVSLIKSWLLVGRNVDYEKGGVFEILNQFLLEWLSLCLNMCVWLRDRNLSLICEKQTKWWQRVIHICQNWIKTIWVLIWIDFVFVLLALYCVGINHQKGEIEREMCPWAISKYFGDLVSNTSA